jgi:pyrimidine-nucleoside phosphorylase
MALLTPLTTLANSLAAWQASGLDDFRKVIAGRRDRLRQTHQDLAWLARGAAEGSIPDYQLSAWLMAAFLNPLDLDETAELTMAMAETGLRLDLSSIPGPHLDKHSTGGVGDKTTLVLLPILASLGVSIVKMSGGGLGVTGGTVDKLSSIPGFQVALTPEQLVSQAARIGLSLSGQSASLAPADGRLYQLRNDTATTDSIPLIASSILSKKVAGGARFVTIDVKCGSGAFITDFTGASRLASVLEQVGERCGLRVQAEITDMSQPLGCAVGNALEVEEALQVLAGEPTNEPTARFRELCTKLAADALVFCGHFSNEPEASQSVQNTLQTGNALKKALEWIGAQGGPNSLDELRAKLPTAAHRHEVRAQQSGWVGALDARSFGEGLVKLGGGRFVKTDQLDYGVGFLLNVTVGSRVTIGERLYTILARSPAEAQAVERYVFSKVEISPQPVKAPPLFL